jgi:hypothetical protein
MKAVAVAPPPGTILPTAFPASCEEATTNQLFTWSARRSSCHKRMKLAASAMSAASVQYQMRCRSECHDERTTVRLGSNTYNETPEIRTSTPVLP